MMSLLCSSSLLVSVIVVVGVALPKCPSQNWCSATSKKSHAYSPASTLVSSSSSVATPLPLAPPQSSRPMNRDDIDREHQHHYGCRTPQSRCRSARRRRDNRAEEDPICQAEEGVIQVVSGVGTITSVVLLHLRRLRRRQRHH